MPVRTDRPIIYLITRGEATSDNLAETGPQILEIIKLAVSERVNLIQIREKRLTARELFELTKTAAGLTRGTATSLLVNDRADIALAAGADGVHLTAGSLSANIIRDLVPTRSIIGVSTHTLEAAEAAARGRADFVVFGPVFETPGKDVKGLSELADVCKRLGDLPVLGLGGINEGNYASVLNAGASGIAAIRSLNDRASLTSISRGIVK